MRRSAGEKIRDVTLVTTGHGSGRRTDAGNEGLKIKFLCCLQLTTNCLYIYGTNNTAMSKSTPRFTAAYALHRLSGNQQRDLLRFADDRQASLVRMTGKNDQRA